MSKCPCRLKNRPIAAEAPIAINTPLANPCRNCRVDNAARCASLVQADVASRYNPFVPRNPFVQVPSQFNALTKEQAAIFPYRSGFISNLPTLTYADQNSGKTTKGLGGTQATINQVAICIYNENDSLRPANAAYRTPSIFTCNGGQCLGGFCFSHGLNDAVNSIQQANIDKGCRNDWSGAATNKFFGNNCIPIRAYGPDNF